MEQYLGREFKSPRVHQFVINTTGKKNMKTNNSEFEKFIVESAVDGCLELFGEVYTDKIATAKEMEPRFDKIKTKIKQLLGEYWDIQLDINGGHADGTSERDMIAKRSASLSTLNFLGEIDKEYRSLLGIE